MDWDNPFDPPAREGRYDLSHIAYHAAAHSVLSARLAGADSDDALLTAFACLQASGNTPPRVAAWYAAHALCAVKGAARAARDAADLPEDGQALAEANRRGHDGVAFLFIKISDSYASFEAPARAAFYPRQPSMESLVHAVEKAVRRVAPPPWQSKNGRDTALFVPGEVPNRAIGGSWRPASPPLLTHRVPPKH